jgi:NAD(P)-dependent dehydrogenase (short-subunit alcohol dehydrogenase family)
VELAGQPAVVTGGAAGLGRAAAVALARAGARVVVVDRDAAAGEATAAELPGGRFEAADVTAEGALERVFADVGELAVLVNNAGGRDEPFFPDSAVERWSAVLDLNLRAPMRATQLAIAAMRRRGGGAIVNVGSSAGVGLGPHPSPEYAAAKAGLMRLTGALVGLSAEGIRVSCVCPGLVDTPAARSSGADMRRARPPEQVAELIVALAADDSSGGRVVSWPDDAEPEVLR